MDDFLKQLGEFTRQTKHVPGRPIMIRVSGSRGFNLHGPQSDWDWYGVFASSASSMLSLNHHSDQDKVHGDIPNYQFHEILPFCKLIVNGNPSAVESLYADHLIHITKEWDALRKIRHRFLTQQLVCNYIAYARGQLKRYHNGQSLTTAGGKPGEKWQYHIIRLAKDAMQVAQGKEPVIYKTADDRDFLLRIRRRELKDEEVVKLAEGMFATVEGMAPYPLPEEPDRQSLDNWMMDVRGLK